MSTLFSDFKQLKLAGPVLKRIRLCLEAGISLNHTIAAMIEDETEPQQKARLNTISRHLEKGDSFGIAIQPLFPHHFPLRLTSQIPLQLSDFLLDLETYIDTKLSAIQSVLKKCLYPLLLLTLSLIGLGIFTATILPILNQFYVDMAIQLPTWIHQLPHMMKIATGIVGAITIFSLTHLKKKAYDWIFPIQTADILWLLGMLLKQGIPLKSALDTINTPILGPFKHHYQKTGLFSQSLQQTFAIPAYYIKLIEAGEKSGNLGQLLCISAQNLHADSHQRLTQKLDLLPSILLMILGCILTGFLYLTFQPIILIISNIK